MINPNTCHICNKGPAVSIWGLGTARCRPCTDDWSNQVQQKRQLQHDAEHRAYTAHTASREEHGECPDDGVVCSECCFHEFDWSEGGFCLNCNVHQFD